MDFIDRLLGRSFSQDNLNSLLKFTDLDPRVQSHLLRVYATLAVTLYVAALGAYADVFLHISGALTYWGALGCLIGLGMMEASPVNLRKRYALLGGMAFCQGASLSPLLQLAVAVQPSLVLTALTGTGVVFTCFSLSALLTKRRAYLYLGGWLSSAVMAMMMMRMMGWLTGYQSLGFSVELYGGLMMFVAYILFDTQMIVERSSAGHMDTVQDALTLFVDLVAIFVRVLVILMKNKTENERKKCESDWRKRA